MCEQSQKRSSRLSEEPVKLKKFLAPEVSARNLHRARKFYQEQRLGNDRCSSALELWIDMTGMYAALFMLIVSFSPRKDQEDPHGHLKGVSYAVVQVCTPA
jgi:hypothetical protein